MILALHPSSICTPRRDCLLRKKLRIFQLFFFTHIDKNIGASEHHLSILDEKKYHSIFFSGSERWLSTVARILHFSPTLLIIGPRIKVMNLTDSPYILPLYRSFLVGAHKTWLNYNHSSDDFLPEKMISARKIKPAQVQRLAQKEWLSEGNQHLLVTQELAFMVVDSPPGKIKLTSHLMLLKIIQFDWHQQHLTFLTLLHARKGALQG